jgi:hypothetical protein
VRRDRQGVVGPVPAGSRGDRHGEQVGRDGQWHRLRRRLVVGPGDEVIDIAGQVVGQSWTVHVVRLLLRGDGGDVAVGGSATVHPTL